MIMGFGSQLSLATGTVKTGISGQLIVLLTPCLLRTGAVVSRTVTMRVFVALLPDEFRRHVMKRVMPGTFVTTVPNTLTNRNPAQESVCSGPGSVNVE